MGELLLVRHALAQEGDRSTDDLGLDRSSYRDIAIKRQQLLKRGYDLGAVGSSPHKRAVSTAELLATDALRVVVHDALDQFEVTTHARADLISMARDGNAPDEFYDIGLSILDNLPDGVHVTHGRVIVAVGYAARNAGIEARLCFGVGLLPNILGDLAINR